MIREPLLTATERDRITDTPGALPRFVEVWQVILARHGMTVDTHPGPIDPAGYALDKRDALWCVDRVMDAETVPLAKTQWAIQWANKGPSHYETKE